MRFGLLYELQLPRPWDEDAEHRMIQNALAEVELADRLGFDCVWANEHHFLEEYSHNSAPEVFLAAAAGRTSRIHVGHAVVLSPPGYNPPARVAERIAMLDLVSSGRAEWGTGSSSSRSELEGFNIDPNEKKAMWAEATEQAANMLAMTPYPGFNGKYFSMPTRNVIPKPHRKPHPPLWLACSNRETIHVAARNGVGALAFAFVDPADAAKWAGEYYDIIKSDECVPIGHSVNANIAMATGFSVHQSEAEARARGQEGFQFFGFALGHFYVYGQHKPGVTSVWDRFELARDALPETQGNGIGTPEQLVDRMRQYQDAGVDQVIFVQQAGRNRHDHIMEALDLFAAEVMPALKADQAARDARKQAELAPFIEAALKRKRWMQPLPADQIPLVPAYGRTVVASDATPASLSARRGGGIAIPSEDFAERKRAAGTEAASRSRPAVAAERRRRLTAELAASILRHMVKYGEAGLDRTFAALVDPTRRAILARLAAEGSASVSDLAKPLPIKLPAVMKHLDVLGDAGLITRSKQGRTVTVRLAPDPMREAMEWLRRYERFWSGRLDRLAAYVERQEAETRKEGS